MIVKEIDQCETNELFNKMTEFIEESKSGDSKMALLEYVDWMKQVSGINTNEEYNVINPLILQDFGVLINSIIQGFTSMYGDVGFDIAEDTDNSCIVLHNDSVFIDMTKEDDEILCSLSFNRYMPPVKVCEITSFLKDIFTLNLLIDSEHFIIDESTGEYIWGDEAIDQYQTRSRGRKVMPIIVYDSDGSIGNC